MTRAGDGTPGQAGTYQRMGGQHAGQFRAAVMHDGRLRSERLWNVTTPSPRIAERLLDVYGGTGPVPWPYALGQFLACLDVRQVGVMVRQAGTALAGWDRQGLAWVCERTHSPNGLACPLAGRRLAGAGELACGCEPFTHLLFTLTDLPKIGVFQMITGSRRLAEWAETARASAVEPIGGMLVAGADGPVFEPWPERGTKGCST